MAKKKKRASYEREAGPIGERKLTVCKCPRCEILYRKFINWTGSGMPRFYCEDCHDVVRNMGTNVTLGFTDFYCKHEGDPPLPKDKIRDDSYKTNNNQEI